MKKLTLSADESVIEMAKDLARRRRTSVSAMFSSLVRLLARREKVADDIPADSITVRATGAIRLPKGKTDRDVLTEALLEKHGLDK